MPAPGKEYKLAVRIAGIIDRSFATSLAGANAMLKGELAQIDRDFARLDKGFNAVARVGQKTFQVLSKAAQVGAVAIGVATAASIKFGVEFESAFAGVRKTVDATEAEFQKLRREILEMSREVPSSAAEIAGAMEIAGQLGIETDQLTNFTETMIKLGVATNMTSEEASMALARFANITQMEGFDKNGLSNWQRLGAAVVDLGNNFETTEQEIVTMATRLASTGHVVGLTEAEILGFATAMSSVGIRTEAGGSTMSKLLRQMQIAVETNSPALQKWAKVANKSADEFAEAFRTNAAGAVKDFILGLNDTDRLGKSAVAVLDEMGIKEVRLTNTILALAGAEGLLGEAISRATNAWGDWENNALDKEAAQRFATVESQARLAGNAFKELGIQAYDEMRPLLATALGEVTKSVHGLIDSNAVPKFINDIQKKIPNVIRDIQKFLEPFFKFLAEGFNFVITHGNEIVSLVIALGTALATYKIASQIVKIVTAFKAMEGISVVSIVIMGVVAALSALAGAASYFALQRKALIDKNLEEHFGSISLSLDQIKRAADAIVNTKNMQMINKAASAIRDLDSSINSMENSLQDIDRMNFMVLMGVDFSENDFNEYQSAISTYVDSAMEYAQKAMYATDLNLNAMTISGGDNPLVQSAIDKINDFKNNQYTALQEKGKELSEYVTKAFEDGLFDIDEVATVQRIQAEMAAIQQTLAMDEYSAQMQLIKLDYSTLSELDADTFKNLQAEIAAAYERAKEAADLTYKNSFQEIQSAFANPDVGMTDEEYNAMLKEIWATRVQALSEAASEGVAMQAEVIRNVYKDELDPAISEMMDALSASMQNFGDMDFSDPAYFSSMEKIATSLLSAINSPNITAETKGAIGTLLKSMEPSVDDIRASVASLQDAGVEAAEGFYEGVYSALDSFDMLYALAGNSRAQSRVAGAELFASGVAEGMTEGLFNQFKDYDFSPVSDMQFKFIHDALESGYDRATQDNLEMAAATAEKITDDFQDSIDSQLLNNPIEVDFYVKPKAHVRSVDISELKNARLNGAVSAGRHASGGIVRNKELSYLAENGPEAVIPLDGKQTSLSLWAKAGQLMSSGRFDSLDLNPERAPINYSPTLQFYGEAPSKEDITGALRVSEEEFAQLMDSYFKTKARYSI